MNTLQDCLANFRFMIYLYKNCMVVPFPYYLFICKGLCNFNCLHYLHSQSTCHIDRLNGSHSNRNFIANPLSQFNIHLQAECFHIFSQRKQIKYMDECFPRVTPQFVFSRTHKVDEAVQNSNIVNFVDS